MDELGYFYFKDRTGDTFRYAVTYLQLPAIPGTTRKKKVVGLERGPLSLVSTTEELLDRKVAAPV
jgi:hypothetical protein